MWRGNHLKQPTGRSRRRCENKLKLETGCDDGRWMELAQERAHWRCRPFGAVDFEKTVESFLCSVVIQ